MHKVTDGGAPGTSGQVQGPTAASLQNHMSHTHTPGSKTLTYAPDILHNTQCWDWAEEEARPSSGKGPQDQLRSSREGWPHHQGLSPSQPH